MAQKSLDTRGNISKHYVRVYVSGFHAALYNK